MKIILIFFLVIFYFFFGLIVTGAIADDMWRSFDWYRELSNKKQNILKLITLVFWPFFGIIYLIIVACCFMFFAVRELLEDVFDIYI